VYKQNIESHASFKRTLFKHIRAQKRKERSQVNSLKTEYESLYHEWFYQHDQQVPNLSKPLTSSAGGSTADSAGASSSNTVENNETQSPVGGVKGGLGLGMMGLGMRSRRNASSSGPSTSSSLFYSDAVKSEAEFEQVLAMITASETKTAPSMSGSKFSGYGTLFFLGRFFGRLVNFVSNARLGPPLGSDLLKIQSQCIKDPDMILDPVERKVFLFDNKNGLVEDAEARLKEENAKLNMSWTQEEIDVFCFRIGTFLVPFFVFVSH
jgi:hypothetical protein